MDYAAHRWGVLSAIQLSGRQRRLLNEEEDANLAGVTYWAAHPWHKLPLLTSAALCLAAFGLLVAVLASSSLYTVVTSSFVTDGNYGGYGTATVTTIDVGPFSYTACTSTTSDDPNSQYYESRAPSCQSQQGTAWSGSSEWSAIQAFLILSCLLVSFSSILIVARAARFTMQRYYGLRYSSRWDWRLLKLLTAAVLSQAVALGLVESIDVSNLLGDGNSDQQQQQQQQQYNYESVGFVYSSFVPHLVSALSLTAAVLVWYALSMRRGVLRAMQVDRSRLMYPGEMMQPRYVQPQQIVVSPMSGDVSVLQAQLAAIKQLYPQANIVIAPMDARGVAPMPVMPMQVQMVPMVASGQYSMDPQQQAYMMQQQQSMGAIPWQPPQQPQYVNTMQYGQPQQQEGVVQREQRSEQLYPKETDDEVPR